MYIIKYSAIFTMVVVTVARLAAEVEYSNLGPNDSYGGHGASAVTGPASGVGHQTVADQFTAGFTGLMTTVEVAVGHIDGPADINISILQNDPATNLPLVSSRLALGTVTAPDRQLVVLTLTTPSSLIAGKAYWLELAPHDAATFDLWYSANDANANLAATSLDSGATFQRFALPDAFRISAIPVRIVSITHQANNHIVLQCSGVPNADNRIEASPDLTPGSFSSLASISVDATGNFQYEDTNPDNLSQRFYRIAYP